MGPSAGVTRRGFLKGAAATLAAPYVLTSSALGGAGRAAAGERVTVAVIGVRNRGGQLLGSLLGHGDAQVVGVCDVDGSVVERGIRRAEDAYADGENRGRYAGVWGTADFREVMAREDVDAVVVATPDHTHALVSIAACRAGKDVYVEKPMTLTIREGRAMVEAVRRYGRVLQVGSQRRSEGGVRHTCELVRNGRIGKVEKVEVGFGVRPGSPQPWAPEPVPEGFDYDRWLGPAPWAPYTEKRCHYNFRFVRDYSGGEMTNWGAHFFDVAQWGLGTDDTGPVEVAGEGEAHATGLYDVYYRVRVSYGYASGVRMTCDNSHKGTRFIGTEGEVGGGKTVIRGEEQIGPDEVHLYRTNRGHMGDFLHCVRTRQDPSAPVEAGHRSATVCHLGNIAMDLGRRLRWDPVREEFPGDAEANRLRGYAYRHPWRL